MAVPLVDLSPVQNRQLRPIGTPDSEHYSCAFGRWRVAPQDEGAVRSAGCTPHEGTVVLSTTILPETLVKSGELHGLPTASAAIPDCR